MQSQPKQKYYSNWANDLLAKGREAGLEEGREAGLEEGRANVSRVLVRLLSQRFGILPASLQAEVDALPAKSLGGLSEALFDFTSLADLEDWLADSRRD